MRAANLTSAEILGLAKATGSATVECDSFREAVTIASSLRGWLKYNSKASKYEVSRKDLTVTVTRK